jgi:hypothetical protein
LKLTAKPPCEKPFLSYFYYQAPADYLLTYILPELKIIPRESQGEHGCLFSSSTVIINPENNKNIFSESVCVCIVKSVYIDCVHAGMLWK